MARGHKLHGCPLFIRCAHLLSTLLTGRYHWRAASAGIGLWGPPVIPPNSSPSQDSLSTQATKPPVGKWHSAGTGRSRRKTRWFLTRATVAKGITASNAHRMEASIHNPLPEGPLPTVSTTLGPTSQLAAYCYIENERQLESLLVRRCRSIREKPSQHQGPAPEDWTLEPIL